AFQLGGHSSWPLRAQRGRAAAGHFGVDEDGAEEAGCRVPLVRADRGARVPASPRLRALRARRDVPYRGLLQARVELVERDLLRGRLSAPRAKTGAEAVKSPLARGALQPQEGPGSGLHFATALVEPRLARGMTRPSSHPQR